MTRESLTAESRALLDGIFKDGGAEPLRSSWDYDEIIERLAAIERAASARERARIREAVEGLPKLTLGLRGGVSRTAVLALLSPPDAGSPE